MNYLELREYCARMLNLNRTELGPIVGMLNDAARDSRKVSGSLGTANSLALVLARYADETSAVVQQNKYMQKALSDMLSRQISPPVMLMQCNHPPIPPAVSKWRRLRDAIVGLWPLIRDGK